MSLITCNTVCSYWSSTSESFFSLEEATSRVAATPPTSSTTSLLIAALPENPAGSLVGLVQFNESVFTFTAGGSLNRRGAVGGTLLQRGRSRGGRTGSSIRRGPCPEHRVSQ
jgi:hypothetical protein